jgi:MFS family permease
MSDTASPPLARLGPIVLAPGVTRANALTLLISSILTSIVSAYLSFAQPYILNEHLKVPQEIQGAVSGNLAFWTEILLILMSGLVGAWSDRVGHRFVFAIGFLVIGVSYALYPWATSVEQLYAVRIVYAMGAAAIGAMFVAVQADYPAETSRGAFTAMVGVLSIVGFAVLIATLAPLPRRLTAAGFDPVEAGRLAFGVVALIAVIGAVYLRVGLRERTRALAAKSSVLSQLRVGFAVARENPRIGLSYAAAVVGRADLAIVTIFLSLWVTQSSLSAGLSATDALVQSGKLFGVIQIAALVFMPILGTITDRLDRATGLAIATAVAAGGYLWTGSLTDLTGTEALFATALLGMGQAGVILTATALMGKEAPKDAMGAVSGVFSLFAALGILLATKSGGWLFDVWRPGAPFIVMGVANAVVLVLAIGVRLRHPPLAATPSTT